MQDFVISTLSNLLGVQVIQKARASVSFLATCRSLSLDLLPACKSAARQADKVSFESPTPEGYHYLGRNHRFVEQLCQFVMANTLARQGKRAARSAVIRTREVTRKTTLLLFRCRNVIEQSKSGHQIVAEEMLLWGWRGDAAGTRASRSRRGQSASRLCARLQRSLTSGTR